MGSLVPTGTEIDRETLLDITVNLIPMGILAFFVALFLVFRPFPQNLFIMGISHFLTIFPLVLLALLTYVAAKVIARDEKKLEERSNEGQGLEARSTAGEEKAPTTSGEGQSDSAVSDDRVTESESGDGETVSDVTEERQTDTERHSERDVDPGDEDELGVPHDEDDDASRSADGTDADDDGTPTETEQSSDERR